MQGLQALDQFKSFVSKIGGLGRYEDTYIVHAAEGETVVPMEVLDQNPLLKKRLFKTMVDMGIEPGRYIVGNELNSKNPVTGQPEFFFKKIIDRVKKAAADVSGYAAPIVGAMYGPAAGAMVGAGLGAFKRENPGDPSQWAQMGALGGLSGIASNLASGQSWLGGKGARGIYSPKEFMNPWDLGKEIYKDPGQMWNPKGFGGPEEDLIGGVTEDEYGSAMELRDKLIADGYDAKEASSYALGTLEKAAKAKGSVLGGMSIMEAAKLWGLGTVGLGLLIKMTEGDQDAGQRYTYEPHGLSYDSMLNPKLQYAQNMPIVPAMAQGGVLDLQQGGESIGPGTGTSDDIPAMLSDGEFVMTAKAVRGAGGGDRREGARKMYQLMENLESGGQLSRLSLGMEARA